MFIAALLTIAKTWKQPKYPSADEWLKKMWHIYIYIYKEIYIYIIYQVVTRKIEEGTGTPLQHSCLENPMDGGAWWAAVYGVAQSRTQLSDFTFTYFQDMDTA